MYLPVRLCVCVCVCVYCTMIERRLTTLPSLDHNQSIVLSFCFEGNKMLILVASMFVGAAGKCWFVSLFVCVAFHRFVCARQDWATAGQSATALFFNMSVCGVFCGRRSTITMIQNRQKWVLPVLSPVDPKETVRSSVL